MNQPCDGKEFRSQTRMTRDPYTAFYTACIMLDLKEDIEIVKIPWYLYRPEVWTWRRRLIKDNSKDYVKRLRYLRALAVVKNYEDTH